MALWYLSTQGFEFESKYDKFIGHLSYFVFVKAIEILQLKMTIFPKEMSSKITFFKRTYTAVYQTQEYPVRPWRVLTVTTNLLPLG